MRRPQDPLAVGGGCTETDVDRRILACFESSWFVMCNELQSGFKKVSSRYETEKERTSNEWQINPGEGWRLDNSSSLLYSHHLNLKTRRFSNRRLIYSRVFFSSHDKKKHSYKGRRPSDVEGRWFTLAYRFHGFQRTCWCLVYKLAWVSRCSRIWLIASLGTYWDETFGGSWLMGTHRSSWVLAR